MSEHITRIRVVYEAPNEGAVTVKSDAVFTGKDGHDLAMDLYYPAEADGPRPAVVLVLGFPDAGVVRALGCCFKEMQSSISWARVLAASGLVAVTYTNRDPAGDLDAVLQHLQYHAGTLGILPDRIGVWASSGHVALALSLFMNGAPSQVACGALLYGYTLDLDGHIAVADAAAKVGFVAPCGGKSAADVRKDTPLFIARAGQDRFPGLNDALDRFVYHGLRENLPLTVVNHPTGPHAFDLVDPSEMSRDIVRRASAFLTYNLIGRHRQ